MFPSQLKSWHAVSGAAAMIGIYNLLGGTSFVKDQFLGYDLIWFGVLFAITCQSGCLTRPFGTTAFYMTCVTPPHITQEAIFNAFWPFTFPPVLPGSPTIDREHVLHDRPVLRSLPETGSGTSGPQAGSIRHLAS